ncbi:RICIN domain-containing protein [Kitasatospora viridis]|uniref:Ricin-type beta-trefoil lectin protein n=1 Tax=Kitasatospora viridis TaxID=281105 RepID=A0A561TWH7_9ACTN|nr:RICIN domain-containing protein [Kitasatospora viridis]TWF91466.1 ricin-type beta-trefoil lectin protein [Kitasatospora viridis]
MNTKRNAWAKAAAAGAIAALMPFAIAAAPAGAVTYSGGVMWTPPSGAPSYGSLYAHAIRLQHSTDANGTLLASFEQYSGNGMPVFRSTDSGHTWTQISTIHDQVNPWNNIQLEPVLYELPQAIGTFPAGTIIAAGDSIPADNSKTKIDMYASTDQGATWSFVSSIATGGAAVASNGYTPVWEPYFLVANNKLIAYISDQRDPAHGQKLGHFTTTDGISWSSEVDDVSYPAYSARPGMAIVTRIGNGNYLLTYEYCNAPTGGCPVYYKIAADPEAFGSVTGVQLVTTDNIHPQANPYVTWLPTGGPNGTIVVQAYSDNQLYESTDNGTTWVRMFSNTVSGYSRGLLPLADGKSLLVTRGGVLTTNGTNKVTYGIDDFGGGISTGAAYKVQNTLSSQVLGVPDSNAGSPVVQAPDNGTPDHNWQFQLQSNGYYRIYNTYSQKYLAVPGGSLDSGTGEVQWTTTGGAEQDWSVQPSPAGGYTITNRRSDLALTMATDANGQTSTDEQVTQAPLTSATNQRWNLLQTAAPDFTTGQFVLTNVNSGKYAEVAGGGKGTQADQYRNVNHPDQYWTFTRAGSYWTITNAYSGDDLDSAGATGSGSAVVEQPASGATSQQWSLTDTGNGDYQVVNRASGLALTVVGAATGDGALLDQETSSAASVQRWTITKIN